MPRWSLVSKDINLRIKATIFGIAAEDYENDRALDDFRLLYTGAAELPEDFWERHPELRSWSERGQHLLRSQAGAKVKPGIPTSACICRAKMRSSCACSGTPTARPRLALLDDYTGSANTACGASARAIASRTSH